MRLRFLLVFGLLIIGGVLLFAPKPLGSIALVVTLSFIGGSLLGDYIEDTLIFRRRRTL